MIKEKFGLKLKELRKKLTDLSQEDFANKIDLDRSYYTSVEGGKRNISLNNIEKIANGLGITISELFKYIES